MPKAKAWYKVVSPREDLREGRPLDASEFAVHLDHIRENRAPKDYVDPERFFDRTYLTANLLDLAAQTLRRLSGSNVETSAVYNMATQFGGGKTHALTLLYHLAKAGPQADGWRGVNRILTRAGIQTTPGAATAVFVGTEFDSLTGRGGTNGEPLRRTPWGEIAWQLGGLDAFRVVEQHDQAFIEPKGDVIRSFLPKDRPSLILMDEIINYVSTYRSLGYNNKLYNFVQALSETARGQSNVVLLVSIPASELEYTADDHADETRFKKMLDRLGKAMVMSAESETSEIVRRRLFEWDGVPPDARAAATEFAEYVKDQRQLLGDIDAVTAYDRFLATYPFHPAVLSVFERKWQSLPRFQKTRGILRLLALWVSRSYVEGYKSSRGEALIALGSAPLDDPLFRAAVFEQLGSSDLEVAVTSDIAGKKDAHAIRLDRESTEDIRKLRLHQRVATTILFESNGGQTKAEATVPEIRFAVGEPGLDIANIEATLEALVDSAYYLTADRNRYRFSLSPNLNKLITDRRASVSELAISERVKEEVQAVFSAGTSMIERTYFPATSSDVVDRPVLRLVVLAPDAALEHSISETVDEMSRTCGSVGRTYKSGLVFASAEGATLLEEEARKLLAWDDIFDDSETLSRLDEAQRRQADAGRKKAARDVKEAVWRSYRYLHLLGRDGIIKSVDLGLIHSSTANSLIEHIINRLRQDDEVTDSVGPGKLASAWPPAFEEWPTKSVRDAFFSTPRLPKLLDVSSLKRTIADGVMQGLFAYVGKSDGGYEPFCFQATLSETDVEISDERFLLSADAANRAVEPPLLTTISVEPNPLTLEVGKSVQFAARGLDQYGGQVDLSTVVWSSSGGQIDESGRFLPSAEGVYIIRAAQGGVVGSSDVRVLEPSEAAAEEEKRRESSAFHWAGNVPPQKWMNFYTRVLSRFSLNPALRIRVEIDVSPDGNVAAEDVEDAEAALRELGLQ